MAIRFDDYMAKLPKKRQQAIKKRTAELIAEEATLASCGKPASARRKRWRRSCTSSRRPSQSSNAAPICI